MSSASDPEPPELQAVHQLEQLVRHLGEELTAFRRRALQAESRLKVYESPAPGIDLVTEQLAVKLQRENADLRSRLDFAAERTRGVLEQLRFLRQQSTRPVPNNGSDR